MRTLFLYENDKTAVYGTISFKLVNSKLLHVEIIKKFPKQQPKLSIDVVSGVD